MPPGNGKVKGMSRMGAEALGIEGLRACNRKQREVMGAAGMLAISAKGSGGDCVFLQALGKGRRVEGGGVFYLDGVIGHPDLTKLGITNNYDRRAREAGYYEGDPDTWDRDHWPELCAIESIRKRVNAAHHVVPEGIAKVSTSEIFRLDRDQEIAEVQLLVDALNEGMSPWELALEFMPRLTAWERGVLEARQAQEAEAEAA